MNETRMKDLLDIAVGQELPARFDLDPGSRTGRRRRVARTVGTAVSITGVVALLAVGAVTLPSHGRASAPTVDAGTRALSASTSPTAMATDTTPASLAAPSSASEVPDGVSDAPRREVAPAVKANPGYTWTDSPADIEMWRRENLVTVVGQRLVPDVNARGIGYAGMVVSGERLNINLWWRGELPATVRKVVQYDSDGVEVQVFPAEHTFVELQGAMLAVAGSAKTDSRVKDANIRLLGGWASVDGSGISFSYMSADPKKPAASLAEAQRIFELVSSVPVLKVIVGSESDTQFVSR